MRTNEERVRLIQNRTAEIKQEKRKKKQWMLDIVCITACLLLVINIGIVMSELTTEIEGENIAGPSGMASMIGSHPAVGYIVMGLLAFILGVCVTVLLYRLKRRNEHEGWEDSRDGKL